MESFLKSFFSSKRLESPKEAWLYLFLGISPLGMFTVYWFFLYAFGICIPEEMSSSNINISCYIPIIEGYMYVLTPLMAGAMILAIPALAWILVGILIWARLADYVFSGKSRLTKITILTCLGVLIAVSYPIFQTAIPLELAQRELNPHYCHYLEEKNIQKQCIFDIYNITSPTQLTDCSPFKYALYIEYGACQLNQAKIKNDITMCDEPELRASSYSGECYQHFIGTEEWKEFCSKSSWLGEEAKCPKEPKKDLKN